MAPPSGDRGTWRRAAVAFAVGALGIPALLIVGVAGLGSTLSAVPVLDNPVGLVLVVMPIGMLAGYLAGGPVGLLGLCGGAEVGLAVALVPFAVQGGEGGGIVGAVWIIFAVALPFAVGPGWLAARLAVRALPAAGAPLNMGRRLAVYLGPATASWGLVLLAAGANGLAIQVGQQASCPTLREHPALLGHLAFVGPNAICVADLTTGATHLVYSGSGDDELDSPAWSQDGQDIAFVRVDRPGGQQSQPVVSLVTVSAAGGPPRQLPNPPGTGDYLGISWSPDGHEMAAATDRLGCSGCGDLWVLELGTGYWFREPLPAEVGSVSEPQWSPDGQRLTLDAMNAGPSTIPVDGTADYGYGPVVTVTLSGETAVTLVGDGDARSPAVWSPDGANLAIAREVAHHGNSDVFLVGADGSSSRPLTSTASSEVVTNYPSWSPDGRYLAVQRFASNALPDSIWLVPVDGGDPVELIAGGTQPAWTAK